MTGFTSNEGAAEGQLAVGFGVDLNSCAADATIFTDIVVVHRAKVCQHRAFF
jgi:hypothetical protein